MSEKRIVTVYADGVHDDTDAIQAIVNGEAIGVRPDGRPWNSAGHIKITRTIEVSQESRGDE